MSTEADLQNKIVKAIRAAYPEAWTFNVHGSPWQMAGVPDLLVCLGGSLIALEIKHQKPGESREHALSRVSPQQHYQIDNIRKAGGVAEVVLSVEEALAVLARETT